MMTSSRGPTICHVVHRRSIRLRGYDYAQAGAYFVTICAHDHACLFGEIVNAEMRLNDAGRMIDDEWNVLTQRFPTIESDESIIMPNHVHGILIIRDSAGATTRVAPTGSTTSCMASVGAPLVGAPSRSPHAGNHHGAGTRPAPTLGDIIGAFKSITTDRYIRGVHEAQWPRFNGHVWQRNYFEHIVRDESEMNRIREYIVNNPAQWETDREAHDEDLPWAVSS
jgi:REP element-mobilizing transposase RayT